MPWLNPRSSSNASIWRTGPPGRLSWGCRLFAHEPGAIDIEQPQRGAECEADGRVEPEEHLVEASGLRMTKSLASLGLGPPQATD